MIFDASTVKRYVEIPTTELIYSNAVFAVGYSVVVESAVIVSVLFSVVSIVSVRKLYDKFGLTSTIIEFCPWIFEYNKTFALSKAKSYRYVDDEEYVRTFLLFNKSRYGARKIIYKLTNEKGVDKNIVENIVFDEIDDDFELELAEKMARKFVKTKKIEDKSDLQKVGAHLFQKGFDWRIINKVMATLFDVYED